MKVKVCGLTNAGDAAFAAAEGADYLGFVVHPASPRHCGNLVEAVKEVRDRAVLVTVSNDVEAILRMASAAGIRQIQPYVFSDHRKDVVQRFKLEGYSIFIPWFEDQTQASIAPDLYIWESNPQKTGVAGGSGQTHAMNFPPPGPFLLAGGLDGDNLRARVALCPPEARIHLYGFDAATGLEQSPGIKDPFKVRTFIQTAKSMTDEVFHARN